jgi:hypothetical protein
MYLSPLRGWIIGLEENILPLRGWINRSEKKSW